MPGNGGASSRPALSIALSALPRLPRASIWKGGTPRLDATTEPVLGAAAFPAGETPQQDARTEPLQGSEATRPAGESAGSRSTLDTSRLVTPVSSPAHKLDEIPLRLATMPRPPGDGPSSPLISLPRPPPVRTPPHSSSHKQQGPTPERSGGPGAQVSLSGSAPVAPTFSCGLRPPSRRTTAYSPAKKVHVLGKGAQSALDSATAAGDTPSLPATTLKPRRHASPATRPRLKPGSRLVRVRPLLEQIWSSSH